MHENLASNLTNLCYYIPFNLFDLIDKAIFT